LSATGWIAPERGVDVDQRALVEQARQGDHDAFTTLAGEAISRLDAAARLTLRDSELARDAVQDALVRAWRDLPGLRDPERFDAWLHRLTINACLDLARRRQRRSIEIELTPIAGPIVVDIASDIADRQLLDDAMRHLSAEGRAIVVLHYYLGMPISDVALALGIPMGTAKSRLSRALDRMRVTIEGAEPSARDPFPGGQFA
jgi:RNA polymerase sigma-70 factor (ECF subfamily)